MNSERRGAAVQSRSCFSCGGFDLRCDAGEVLQGEGGLIHSFPYTCTLLKNTCIGMVTGAPYIPPHQHTRRDILYFINSA